MIAGLMAQYAESIVGRALARPLAIAPCGP
jgi:hypothetical protein